MADFLDSFTDTRTIQRAVSSLLTTVGVVPSTPSATAPTDASPSFSLNPSTWGVGTWLMLGVGVYLLSGGSVTSNPPRRRFRKIHLLEASRFDPRSFRTIRLGHSGRLMTVGCRRGHWHPTRRAARKCDEGVRGQRVLVPRRNPKRVTYHSPEWDRLADCGWVTQEVRGRIATMLPPRGNPMKLPGPFEIGRSHSRRRHGPPSTIRFYGAFSDPAKAEARAAQVGGTVKAVTMRGQRRWSVMTA